MTRNELLRWIINNFDLGTGKEGLMGTKPLYVADLYEVPEGSTLYYYWVGPDSNTPFKDMEIVINWPLADGGTEIRLWYIPKHEIYKAVVDNANGGPKIDLSERTPLAINEAIVGVIRKQTA